jgi:hypothetical protein
LILGLHSAEHARIERLYAASAISRKRVNFSISQKYYVWQIERIFVHKASNQ